MIAKEDIDYFKHCHNFDHVANIGGGALFNPCSLLMFVPSDVNIYVYNALFAHEFAHARLSSCLYGKIIFFLKFISLRVMQYCFEVHKGNHFEEYWNIHNRFNVIIKEYLKGWILTQEGYATFYERRRINQFNDFGIQILKDELNDFLKKNTPYSKGLKLIDNLNIQYSEVLLRNITHELGNINYTNQLKNLISEKNISLEVMTPDKILMDILNNLMNDKKKNYIVWTNDKNAILNSRESVNPIVLARSLIIKNCKHKNYTFYDIEQNNIFLDLFACIRDFVCVGGFEKYIDKMRENYIKKVEFTMKEGGVQQVLAFPSKKINKDDFWEIIIDNKNVLEEEVEFLNFITNLNRINSNHLPIEKKVYQSKLKKLKNKFKDSFIGNFILRIFPPTRIKSYQSHVILNNYPSTIKQFNKMKKQMLEIKCSNDLANELVKLYENHSPLISVNNPDNDNSFKHWSEVLQVTVTIIASSVTIIDILGRWLKEKKDKSAKDQTIIIINDKKMDSLEHLEEIELLLEKMKEELPEEIKIELPKKIQEKSPEKTKEEE